MRVWFKYFVLSFLFMAVLEIGPTMCFFLLEYNNVITIGTDVFFYAQRFSILFIVLILQGCLFYQNKKHREMRLKFLIAFCSIYAFLFAAGYVIRVYVALLNDANSPFIAEHTLFVLPLIVQVLIFFQLFRKKEKTDSVYS